MNGSSSTTGRVLVEEAHKAYIRRLSGRREGGFEHWATEHLRMSGLYWGLCALDMLDALPPPHPTRRPPPASAAEEGPESSPCAPPASGQAGSPDEEGPSREELVAWVMACQCENGGFGGSVGHDPHLLYTLSAVQVRPFLPPTRSKRGLRFDDGGFVHGGPWLQVLAILDAMDALDRDRTATYVASLQRPDGAFMGDEWGEVDTRFVYCALNCLSLLGRLPVRLASSLSAWVI